MPNNAAKKLAVRNDRIQKLRKIDDELDYLLAYGSQPGDAEIDSLLYDRTLLFDALAADGANPWEYGEKSWVKS